MTWQSGDEPDNFDSRVRARRPRPDDELVDRLTSRRRARGSLSHSIRLVTALAVIAAFVGALSVSGALGYAKSGLQGGFSQAKAIVSSGPTTVVNSAADTQYRPGKGCGDKNHLHDRRFECKVVISGVSAKEGNTGSKAFSFVVSLSGTPVDPVTVDYATAGGTATAGVDFTSTAGTLTFQPGQTSKSVAVLVTGDTLREVSETFYLNLSNPSPNAYLGSSQAVGTIINDD